MDKNTKMRFDSISGSFIKLKHIHTTEFDVTTTNVFLFVRFTNTQNQTLTLTLLWTRFRFFGPDFGSLCLCFRVFGSVSGIWTHFSVLARTGPDRFWIPNWVFNKKINFSLLYKSNSDYKMKYHERIQTVPLKISREYIRTFRFLNYCTCNFKDGGFPTYPTAYL